VGAYISWRHTSKASGSFPYNYLNHLLVNLKVEGVARKIAQIGELGNKKGLFRARVQECFFGVF
jgi:hypothetical protein